MRFSLRPTHLPKVAAHPETESPIAVIRTIIRHSTRSHMKLCSVWHGDRTQDAVLWISARGVARPQKQLDNSRLVCISSGPPTRTLHSALSLDREPELVPETLHQLKHDHWQMPLFYPAALMCGRALPHGQRCMMHQILPTRATTYDAVGWPLGGGWEGWLKDGFEASHRETAREGLLIARRSPVSYHRSVGSSQ